MHHGSALAQNQQHLGNADSRREIKFTGFELPAVVAKSCGHLKQQGLINHAGLC